jgi:glycosyltransferase involved in cell wall biosynthesis
MISLIVPTRNRAHTLKLVAETYFRQELVTEVIVVDDAGVDDTGMIIGTIASRYGSTRLIFSKNKVRCGASASRNVGVKLATNEYILFVDDDEYLEPRYAAICLEKLLQYNASIVSGRRVYMLPGETPIEASRRFGNGLRDAKPFNYMICELVNGARYSGDKELPITNAIILTRRDLLLRHPYDANYARGNGYREESDYQMNLFVNGHKIVATNDVHSMHLPLQEVRIGGQRTHRLNRIFWSIYYTSYFYKKYYHRYAQRVKLVYPRTVAMLAFVIFCFYRELLRPYLRKIAENMVPQLKSR